MNELAQGLGEQQEGISTVPLGGEFQSLHHSAPKQIQNVTKYTFCVLFRPSVALYRH